MAGIVVDASALFPLYVPDEDAAYSERVLRLALLGEDSSAPSFCLIEFGNCILNGVRRKRLSEVEAVDAHRDFAHANPL